LLKDKTSQWKLLDLLFGSSRWRKIIRSTTTDGRLADVSHVHIKQLGEKDPPIPGEQQPDDAEEKPAKKSRISLRNKILLYCQCKTSKYYVETNDGFVAQQWSSWSISLSTYMKFGEYANTLIKNL